MTKGRKKDVWAENLLGKLGYVHILYNKHLDAREIFLEARTTISPIRIVPSTSCRARTQCLTTQPSRGHHRRFTENTPDIESVALARLQNEI